MATTLSKRIFKTVSWLGISEILTAGAGFVFTLFIADHLDVADFGVFNYALVLVTTIGVIIELGLTKLVTREVATDKQKTKKFLLASIILRLLFALPAIGILLIFNAIFGTESSIQTISFILLGHILFLYINHSFYSIYRAHEKTNLEAAAKLINTLVIVGGTAYILAFNGTVTDAAWIYFLSTALPVLLHLPLSRKITYSKEPLELNTAFFKNILREAWPFALSTIFVYLYYFVDSIFLGIIQGEEAVAYYNIAYKILFVAIISIGFFYSGIFPIATKYAKEDKDLYYQILDKAFKLIFSFAILFAIGSFFYADDILILLFDQKYINSIIPTQILGLNAIMIAFNILLIHLVLDVFKQQKKSMAASGVGAIGNIILNAALIPFFGIIGATVATISTEVVVGIILVSITSIAGKIHLFRNTTLLLLAGTATFGVLYLLNPFLNFLILIPIQAIVFTLFAFAFKAISLEDIKLLKSLR